MVNPGSEATAQRSGGRLRKVILGILLVAAAGEFVVRGPARFLQSTGWNDLAQYYTTSRLWLRGQDFTSGENFAAAWRDQTGRLFSTNTVRVHVSPPPGALLLFAPIGALPWRVAVIVWLGVLLTSFAGTIWALATVSGLAFRESRGLAFLAGCLALAPFHTGIATGNQTIVIVALCALGIWAAEADCDTLAGLFFGTACSLKPHIGAFLVLYYLLHRRWRLFITAVTLTVVLALIAIAWSQFAGVHWFSGYANNLRLGAEKNTIDDFSSANPIRFMLINLQVPFYSFTHGARSANIAAFGLGALLLVVWTILAVRSEARHYRLLALSTVAVLGLLPLYHRFYDAAVLAIPLSWCLSRPESMKNVANAALLLMSPFLVPGAAVLQQASSESRIPQALASSSWWDRVIMPHQTWFLLLVVLLMLFGMAQETHGNLQVRPRSSSPNV